MPFVFLVHNTHLKSLTLLHVTMSKLVLEHLHYTAMEDGTLCLPVANCISATNF